MSRQNEADITADARVKAAIAEGSVFTKAANVRAQAAIAHADAKAIKDAVVDAGQAQAN